MPSESRIKNISRRVRFGTRVWRTRSNWQGIASTYKNREALGPRYQPKGYAGTPPQHSALNFGQDMGDRDHESRSLFPPDARNATYIDATIVCRPPGPLAPLARAGDTSRVSSPPGSCSRCGAIWVCSPLAYNAGSRGTQHSTTR